MSLLRYLLGASTARVPPPPIESDDVYPTYMLDDTKTLRGLVLTWTLQFNDVLDAEKLHSSLSTLLEIGDWRKIGGRLRFKMSFVCVGYAKNARLMAMRSWRFVYRSRSQRNGQPCRILTKPWTWA
jgi:hypothetical protein